MFRPIEVRPLPDYRLFLRYEDGVEGEVDLSHLVGRGVFSIWTDKKEFEKVGIAPSGEIRWSDTIDLCPDALYMAITRISPEDLFPSLRPKAGEAI